MKRDLSFLKVIFVGQFPPPVNGLTYITSRLAVALAQAGYELTVIKTTGPPGSRSILFHVLRILKVTRALLSIALSALSASPRICYFTAEGGLGLIYSVMFAGCARLFRLRIYIHHHSFSYIVRRLSLMNLLISWCGSDAVHICLCPAMAQALANRYRRDIRSIVLSNAAFVDAAASEVPAIRRKELRIGLLSNLTADKGLHEFLGIVRSARQRLLPIRAILAGPMVRDADKAAFQAAKQTLGDYLEYRGPVYNEEKARFFRDIDVFVFLTTYPNEAQPTVLFEAMANGIPVISYDRGCIRSQVGDGGYVFHQEVDIIAEALRVLERYCEQPECLAAERRAALSQFDRERRLGEERTARLFELTPTETVSHRS